MHEGKRGLSDIGNTAGFTRLCNGEDTMKILFTACGLALAAHVSVSAQSTETTTKTKIEVKDGRDVKVTGCVDHDSRGRYVLTDVKDGHERLHRYILVSDANDFSKMLGQRVRIEGRLADSVEGKVEIKTETKVDGDRDTHGKAEGPGPYIGVKHMERVEGACP